MKISDKFSEVIACQQKTDLKQPTIPCGLGLKAFLLFFRQRFLKYCIPNENSGCISSKSSLIPVSGVSVVFLVNETDLYKW